MYISMRTHIFTSACGLKKNNITKSYYCLQVKKIITLNLYARCWYKPHSSRFVSIRQHTSAYASRDVSIRQQSTCMPDAGTRHIALALFRRLGQQQAFCLSMTSPPPQRLLLAETASILSSAIKALLRHYSGSFKTL